jgi:hypothetical protein
MTWCMPYCVMSGSPGHSEFTCPDLAALRTRAGLLPGPLDRRPGRPIRLPGKVGVWLMVVCTVP